MEQLSAAAVRVLGALIEKAITTPDTYPLTLNALVNACNQTSNRSPVVDYDEATVLAAIEQLRHKNLVHQIKRSDSRVIKYNHVADEGLTVDARELAVMCVLLLRGPQTAGEIRGRTDRLHTFASIEEVDATLEALATRPDPLAGSLPRRPGQKEIRFAHLLSGDIALEPTEVQVAPVASPRQDEGRLDALEARVDELTASLEAMRAEFRAFRKAFE